MKNNDQEWEVFGQSDSYSDALLMHGHRDGGHRVCVRFSDHGGYLGVVQFFAKETQPNF